jgi:hypothetical protein
MNEWGWNGMMKVPMQALPEIYWWMYRIFNNKRLSLRWSIPLETLVTDASPQGWGATLELRTGEVLVSWGIWNEMEAKWTSNKKEMEVIS